jgi:hypothetical protein
MKIRLADGVQICPAQLDWSLVCRPGLRSHDQAGNQRTFVAKQRERGNLTWIEPEISERHPLKQ